MIGWHVYLIFALAAMALWAIGAVAAFRHDERCSRWSLWTTVAGIVVYAVFIGGLWTSLQRPPLHTFGKNNLFGDALFAMGKLHLHNISCRCFTSIHSFFLFARRNTAMGKPFKRCKQVDGRSIDHI